MGWGGAVQHGAMWPKKGRAMKQKQQQKKPVDWQRVRADKLGERVSFLMAQLDRLTLTEQGLRAMVAARDAEIARLKDKLAGYEAPEE